MKKIALLAFVSMLFSTAMIGRSLRPVASYPAETDLFMEVELPVHNIDSGKNFSTIQGAINDNETLDGHSIFVDAGVYVENIVVNKSVSLIGENRNAIVDGNGIENVLTITQNNVTIVGFTLRNAGLHPNAGIHLNNTNYCNVTKNNIESGYYGILFEYSSNNTISGNTITNNTNGIYVEFSFNNNLQNNDVVFSSLAGVELRDSNTNTVSNNDLRNNDMGISLRHSSNNHINRNLISNGGAGIWIEQSVANLVNNNTIEHNQNGIIFKLSGGNTLRNNNLTDNAYNFGHYQTVTHNLSHLINDIDPSNTINKKPIYYWVNQHDKQIPADASYVAIINSTNILVESLNLTQNRQNVLCAFSNNVTVKNLNVSHTWSLGILLLFSSNSTIANNSITNNGEGVVLWSSDSNVMMNNIITLNFGDGIDLYYSEHNSIQDNMVVKNDKFGIHLVQSHNNIINRNIISNNSNDYPGSGIDLYNSTSNRITQNTISENGSPAFPTSGGIRTLYSSDNTIFHNNFNSNVRQVYTTDSTNAWDNGFEGNYWDDYNGKDANQDGIGDAPYIIDESNQDNYPLMHSHGSIRNLDTSLTYLTIQYAIDASETLDGHTIFVEEGTYYENVVVNKAISLVGESRSTAIIDGNRSGVSVSVWSTDFTISGFTIRNGDEHGVAIYSNSCIISNNVITNNHWAGVLISAVSDNTIINNIITSNHKGIEIFFGPGLEDANNTISGNKIALNDLYGIYIVYSSGNKIYLNNFINNGNNTYSTGSVNTWDNGYPSGGNYWSDYEERYPNAREIDNSDIWDTPYVIDANNQDNYPIVPEFPALTSILLILIVLTVAVAIYKRRLLKTPIH